MNKNIKLGVDSASSTQTFWQKTKKFLYTTLNAMTFGIFGTIVIGAIVQTIGSLLGIHVLEVRLSKILFDLLGMGIGLSIGLGLKLDGLKLVVISVAGGISTLLKVDFNLPNWYDPNLSSNNPITAYFVVVIVYLIIQLIFRKKTVYDLFFIPLIGVLSAVFVTFLISYPIDLLMKFIYSVIQFFMTNEPYLTSAFVALIFGILLTLPFISSAGVAVAIFAIPFKNGDPYAIMAMCAAVVGCSAQMIGFSVQTMRKNDIGTIFTVGLASSMFQFKNVMKKPIVWIPSLIASFSLAPLSYLLFGGYKFMIDSVTPGNNFSASWPGMGTSGLVGQLQTLAVSGYSLESWLFVGAQIILPLILVLILDIVFIKMKWYSDLDLILDTSL